MNMQCKCERCKCGTLIPYVSILESVIELKDRVCKRCLTAHNNKIKEAKYK